MADLLGVEFDKNHGKVTLCFGTDDVILRFHEGMTPFGVAWELRRAAMCVQAAAKTPHTEDSSNG